MNINNGTMKELTKGEEIDEKMVHCPKAKKALGMMCDWGKPKRQRYAELVKVEGYATYQAFYFVEFNNGQPMTGKA